MLFQMGNLAPFLLWLRHYTKRHFKADLIAGLTVAVVAVPQSMAYALIAGVPVQYGLYASIAPTIAASLWGSSAHLITGPTTAVSLVIFSSLHRLAEPGSAPYLELVFLLALMVGVLQIIMGLARLGNLLNYIAHSVLLGFTAGAAVLIGVNQLPAFLGIKIKKSSMFFETISSIATNLSQIHWMTFFLGMTTIAAIILVKRFRPSLPGALIAMIMVSGSVAIFNLDAGGVKVVGSIPGTLPPFHASNSFSDPRIGDLVSGAVAIAILGLVEAVSIARAIAAQTRQRLDVNQEIIGQGIANIAASFFSGLAGSGSFTRSAVNFQAGGRTPLSGIISGGAVALTVFFAGPLAATLPMSALSGVLMIVSYDMIKKRDIARTLRATRSDGTVLIITFLSTLFLNIEFAVYVGVLLSIVLHLAKTSHPRIFSTIPDLKTGKMVRAGYEKKCCQMDILQIEGSIFFGSAAYIQNELELSLGRHPDTANLLLRMHQVNILDASGVHVIEITLEEIKKRGGGLYFSRVNSRVFEVLKNSGLLKEVNEEHIRETTGSAIRLAMAESFYPDLCAKCSESIFTECPELKKGNWSILGKEVRPRTQVKESRNLQDS
jgi:SulP family sulfate permease